MLPLRYIGAIHCFGLMFREEGMKGLYRGYIAYFFATIIYLAIVPIAAELMMHKTALYGKFEDNSDLYNEVMDKINKRKSE
jgi:hypothetical protein